MASWPSKDPNDVLDYDVDWSRRLDSGDTISTATFSLTTDAGLTIASQSNTTTVAKVWLSGGTAALTGEILCRIVTANGRTMDQSVSLPIASR